MIGHDYDSDPDALAWARAAVQREIDRIRGFERQATERGVTDPAQWRRFAHLMEMAFIGGEGCVIAAFDERLPGLKAMIDAAGNDPDEVAF